MTTDLREALSTAFTESEPEAEVVATVEQGEQFPVKFGRTGFRRNFRYDSQWRGKPYRTKQLEVVAVKENGWLVITIIVRYF